MKPFNLERAIAGDKVVTRAGDDLKFIGRFPELGKYCVLAIKGSEIVFYIDDGKFWGCGDESADDLMLAPKTVKPYVNVYESDDHTDEVYFGSIADSKEKLEEYREQVGFIKTIEFEVEI